MTVNKERSLINSSMGNIEPYHLIQLRLTGCDTECKIPGKETPPLVFVRVEVGAGERAERKRGKSFRNSTGKMKLVNGQVQCRLHCDTLEHKSS